MSSYSLFCFFLIVQSVAPGLNYCVLFKPCSECTIINFPMFSHYWFPMTLVPFSGPCKHNLLDGRSEVSSESHTQQRRAASTLLLVQGTCGEVSPRAGTVLCHQLSMAKLLGKKWSHQNCPSAMPSLCSAYVKKSESSCHIALIKWAKDCYHRVMGSCWSINVGAKLEAFMQTMWKAWNLLSEEHSAGPFSLYIPIAFSYKVFIPVQMRGIFI